MTDTQHHILLVDYARERKQAERDRAALLRAQTARVEAEGQRQRLDALTAELGSRERRLRAIFDGARDAMLLADDSRRYIDANKAAEALIGRSRAELLACTIDDLIVPEQPAELVVAAWHEFRRVGSQSGEYRLQHPSELRTVEFVATADILPGVHLSVLRDITARAARDVEHAELLQRERLARAAAERAQQRLGLLAEVSAALATSTAPALFEQLARLLVPRIADWFYVCLQGEDGRLTQTAVSHVEPSQVQLLHELFARFPPSPDESHGSAAVVRTGCSEWLPQLTEEQLDQQAQSGAHRALLARLGAASTLTVPLSVHGRTFGALVLGVGDSRPRYSDGDLALAEELARRAAVAAENARLFAESQRERERAEQANRAKDEFLATVSHELRTPLNAILGWAVMARSGDLSPEKQDSALATIERSARAQAQLIDDILDVARIISGKLRVEFQPVSLNAVVSAAAEVVRPTAEARGVDLNLMLLEQPDLVLGDADRLQQIVWNLLSNALKFTPSGGRVDTVVARTGDKLEIRVRDSGRGIAPGFLPHVFERFRQADSAPSRAHGGLGLGLAIVRHLVELHGGAAAVSSPGLGFGATFTVTLPAQAKATDEREPAEVAAVDPAKAARARRLKGLAVLLVDDDNDARELAATVLSHHGATVSTAASAPEALLRLRERRPDVIVSDLAMPGQDGFSLIKQVRAGAVAGAANVPAAALTAYARDTDARKAIGAGFQLHAAKPIAPTELVELVATLSGRYC